MPRKTIPETTTLESSAYLEGLFDDFEQQMNRYKSLTAHLMGLEARLDLAEKTLSLTRDHLKIALQDTEGSKNYHARFLLESAKVRFIGTRLSDACEQVMAQHKKMTTEKLLDAINEGTFRFRTKSPLREIHAALMKHPHIRRVGNYYIWAGPKEDRLAVLEATNRPAFVVEGKVVESKPKEEVKPN
jgi:hypothetical protein